ncbi:integrase/recombinase XerD [Arcticibacter pallidicorallinus]|uniref:Integrase/recombinase XerD n=1 Tax=Arcticibacter pallidicorallinus TaxID=1259464 RepID=A0A2T0TSC2_9SPHI|nr:tyrosine-type recombinase/integrase [Arcticibacter pallidicorallinus]PRY48543.1 integrase/recombinase XerD [Arcticibacter pallidicorallinus]
MKVKKHKAGNNLQLKNPLYIRLQAGFSEWLRILNFEPSSQKYMPGLLGEFLSFLEEAGCNTIAEIQEKQIREYLEYLSIRPNRKWEGGLSKNYIRKYLQVIRKFARYLAESGQESFTADIQIKGKATNIKSILTKAEIRKLYEATADDKLGLRDKAMLALYYGCGLRKNEGLSLNVTDILLDKELVHVRKGKGYKERYVPLAGAGKTDLETYLNHSRPYLLNNRKEEALLVNISGKRLKTAFERIQKLRAEAGINKVIGLHTLRHSIATHLLQSGMKLEQIQRFLGHSSLESTQIYTHIIHEAGL